MAAADSIRARGERGRAALVICADIARYGLETAGEPTQGGGAVAMLVSDTPDLFTLDHGVSGVDSSDVHDFWRPHGRREALVDGHYSIDCYLDALGGAYRMWRDRAFAESLLGRDTLVLPSEQLARIVYHVPFCKMANKAHAHLRRCDGVDDDPAASFERQVAPSLGLASRIGNTYTGSLYLGLASLLHAEGDVLAGKRIGLFSYGSGSSSEFFSGVVGARAASVIARADIEEHLARRTRIDVPEYERIMGLAGDAPLAEAPERGEFRFAGVERDRRLYVTS
jgi:hydroxymethylglutaryl-CoA synthase